MEEESGQGSGVRRIRSAVLDDALSAAARITAVARARFGSRRPPVHPGHFLETRYLEPLGITQGELAAALGVSRRRVNELLRGHRAITPDTAIRLAALFGHEPDFWTGLQSAWDLHEAVRGLEDPRAADERG